MTPTWIQPNTTYLDGDSGRRWTVLKAVVGERDDTQGSMLCEVKRDDEESFCVNVPSFIESASGLCAFLDTVKEAHDVRQDLKQQFENVIAAAVVEETEKVDLTDIAMDVSVQLRRIADSMKGLTDLVRQSNNLLRSMRRP